MSFRMKRVFIESVKVVGRYRQDLGDLESLARSIQRHGLMNPITVTSDGELIAGQRRLEACKKLGMTTIDARIADSLESAIDRLRAERDENTERKAMTPEELVSLGRALEALERPKAAERMRAGVKQPSAHVSGGLETREVVAEALGVSASTYERAKTVVNAAYDEAAPVDERQVAKAALADMNATGNVHGNYEKVRKARDGRLGAPQRSPLMRAAQQRKALNNALNTLAGLTHGLALIDTINPEITSDEAVHWADGLAETRRVVESLIKRLRAHRQGGQ